MPFSDIDVCSNAMVLLGLEPISSFVDKSPQANVCAIRYPLLKERLLSTHIWKFTVTKTQLSRDTVTPNSKYKYQYHMPGDASVHGVIAAYASDVLGVGIMTQYVIQGNFLLTNETSVYVDYQRLVGETDWPPYFTDFAAHALAVDCALTLTKDRNIRDSLSIETYGTPSSNLMGGLHGLARSQDSKYSPPNNVIEGFPLIMARHGSA